MFVSRIRPPAGAATKGPRSGRLVEDYPAALREIRNRAAKSKFVIVDGL